MPRLLTVALAILFAAWLGSVAALLCFFAGLVGTPALVATGVVWIGLPPILAALLIFTNTRRPAGIDPNPAPIAYGRRQDDEVSVTEELSAVLERAAAGRVGPSRTPDWFSDARVTVTKDET
jgi:hypothetical protein